MASDTTRNMRRWAAQLNDQELVARPAHSRSLRACFFDDRWGVWYSRIVAVCRAELRRRGL